MTHDSRSPRRRAGWRLLFVGVVVLLWSIVLLGGLEAFSRYQRSQIERRNPFVVAARGGGAWTPPHGATDTGDSGTAAESVGQSPSADHSTPLRTVEQEVRQIQEFKGLPSLAFEEDPDSANMAAWKQQAQALVNAPVDQRDAFAQGLQQIAVTLDNDRRVLACYGDTANPVYDLIRGMLVGRTLGEASSAAPDPALRDAIAHFDEAAHKALQSGKPVVFSSIGRGGAGNPQPIIPVSGVDGVKILMFVRVDSGEDKWDEPGIRMKPNFAVDENYQTNNFGFRSADIQVPKPDGVLRVVCIGGSTTEEGPTNDTTYPAILQALLRERYGTDRIEVVNAGISGMNAREVAEHLDNYLELDPDILIEYNFVNDAGAVLNELASRSGFLARVATASVFLNTNLGHWLLPSSEAVAGAIQNTTISYLGQICDRAQAEGVTMAICSFAFPDPDRLTRDERDYFRTNAREAWLGSQFTFEAYCRLVEMYNGLVRDLCEQRGAAYLPVAENLYGGTDTFGDICHMLESGIRRKAQVIADSREKAGLPTAPKDGTPRDAPSS